MIKVAYCERNRIERFNMRLAYARGVRVYATVSIWNVVSVSWQAKPHLDRWRI